MIEINKQEEIEKFYDEKTNTYVFNEDVTFKCDIDIESNIKALDIDAYDINAYDIDAKNIDANDIIAKMIDAWDINVNNITAKSMDVWDINANDITANDIGALKIRANSIVANNISYDVFCIAYDKLKCKKIEGRDKNAIHECLNNDIEFID